MGDEDGTAIIADVPVYFLGVQEISRNVNNKNPQTKGYNIL
jgi:hypothetical protein